jgi:hypothetical protein
MKNRRYYLRALVSLVLALHGATAGAQTSDRSFPGAEPDCKALSRDAAPVLPDSADSSKQLVGCGFKLSDQDDFAGSQQLFKRAADADPVLATRLAALPSNDEIEAALTDHPDNIIPANYMAIVERPPRMLLHGQLCQRYDWRNYR